MHVGRITLKAVPSVAEPGPVSPVRGGKIFKKNL